MIIIIDGGAGETMGALANMLRNAQVASGKGALLVMPDQEGAPENLLEKIIAGDPFVPGTDIDSINWKDDPLIVVSSERADILGTFEQLVPGFSARFGPTETLGIVAKKGLFSGLFGG